MKHTMRDRVLFLLLCGTLLGVIVFTEVSQEGGGGQLEGTSVTVGDFTLASDSGLTDTDYTYSAADHTLTIKSGKTITISMKSGVSNTTQDYTVVQDGVTANITLSGVIFGGESDTNAGKVYGSPTGATLTIPASQTLTIPAGMTPTIPQRANLINSGTFGITPDGGDSGSTGSTVKTQTTVETNKGSGSVDFGTGKVTVTLDYTRKAQDTDIAVYFADDVGTLTAMPGATFQDGKVRFETSHWSVYAVTEEARKFTDVAADAWYAPAVRYVVNHGLFAGTSDTTFSPNSPMTRAMLATVLYRAAGEPSMENEIWGYPFADVDAGSWYDAAVYWARLNGIVSGYSDERFGPGDCTTREQLAVMLYRYAGSPAVPNLVLDFTDAGELTDSAQDAMRWAVDKGIVTGTDSGLLDPKGQATRAQVAVMLMRYLTTQEN